MEFWNDGIVGFQWKLFILNFIVKMNFAIYPILQYPKPIIALTLHCVPNIPTFHLSNWGEAPNLGSIHSQR
jgi:hypothetical protein